MNIKNNTGIAFTIIVTSVIGVIYVGSDLNKEYPEDFPSYPAITNDEWKDLGVNPPSPKLSPKQVIRYWGDSHSLKSLYGEEFETIMEAAKANDCTKPELLSILFAIRTAENGRAGIEFGVLNPKAVDQPNSLRVQAGWCAATISKNYKRWTDSPNGWRVDFITFLGNRYCPVGADNDPNGLNKHWIPNVRAITERNLNAMYK